MASDWAAPQLWTLLVVPLGNGAWAAFLTLCLSSVLRYKNDVVALTTKTLSLVGRLVGAAAVIGRDRCTLLLV